jgi:hypothetical protein
LDCGGSELEVGILVLGIVAFRVSGGRFDLEVADLLEGVLLRKGKPDEEFAVVVVVGRNVDLISEGEGARRKRRGPCC